MNQSNWSVNTASNNLDQLHFNIFPQLMCSIDFGQNLVIIIAEQYETHFFIISSHGNAEYYTFLHPVMEIQNL